MGFRELSIGRNFVARVKYDSDLLKFVTELARKKRVTIATFIAIGALKNAKLGFYDQKKHEYSETLLLTSQEIASCIGNVSIKDDAPFVHAHAVLADQNGNTHAGHLLEGKVFAAEIHLTELEGAKFVRKNDPVTGLSLWEI